MEKPQVRVYTDYKSPYAFVANKAIFALEQEHGVELEWLPYTLRIPEFMGSVEARTPHFWRKVRYLYMDARRFALYNVAGAAIWATAFCAIGYFFGHHASAFYHQLVRGGLREPAEDAVVEKTVERSDDSAHPGGPVENSTHGS